jgi:hypothetical protein
MNISKQPLRRGKSEFYFFRKFDGIAFKYDNNEIKLLYEGGLAAVNKINSRIGDTQINQIEADKSVYIDEEI